MTVNPDPVALMVHQLGVSYPDGPPILQDVSLRIQSGERVGLVGPNGAGKTTLFLSVTGILRPTVGQVSLFGQPVRYNGFNRQVGMIFQDANDQLFSPSVADDIAFGLYNLGLSPDVVRQRVTKTVSRLGIEHLLARPPHQLSGGEKRMVALAGVLAMEPGLVVYDEPGASLDIRARRNLLQFLQAVDHTVLLASHDLDLVLTVCPRVLLLDGGQLVADGPAAQVLGDASLMAAHGLEVPWPLRR